MMSPSSSTSNHMHEARKEREDQKLIESSKNHIVVTKAFHNSKNRKERKKTQGSSHQSNSRSSANATPAVYSHRANRKARKNLPRDPVTDSTESSDDQDGGRIEETPSLTEESSIHSLPRAPPPTLLEARLVEEEPSVQLVHAEPLMVHLPSQQTIESFRDEECCEFDLTAEENKKSKWSKRKQICVVAAIIFLGIFLFFFLNELFRVRGSSSNVHLPERVTTSRPTAEVPVREPGPAPTSDPSTPGIPGPTGLQLPRTPSIQTDAPRGEPATDHSTMMPRASTGSHSSPMSAPPSFTTGQTTSHSTSMRTSWPSPVNPTRNETQNDLWPGLSPDTYWQHSSSNFTPPKPAQYTSIPAPATPYSIPHKVKTTPSPTPVAGASIYDFTSTPNDAPAPNFQHPFLSDFTLRAIERDPTSPQARALIWFESHPNYETDMPTWRRRQLMALATLLYSTGLDHVLNDSTATDDAHECDWRSNGLVSECTPDGRYRSLYLRADGLAGQIPPEISFLQDLSSLSMGENRELSGNVPSELGLMTALTFLDLKDNQLDGPVPAQIGALTNLRHLYLLDNDLTGEIPPQLCNSPSLQVLIVDCQNVTCACSKCSCFM